MKFTNIVLASLLTGASVAANAAVIDFKQMGNQNERGYAVLSTADMDITGYVNDYNTDPTTTTEAYAYLDAAWGGLGVCGALDQDYQCNPASDDNVTGDMNIAEILNFKATSNITITNIWFNNNHDDDKSLLNDIINIDGNDYQFTAADQTNVSGSRSDWLWLGAIDLLAGESFDISFAGEQFYVTKIMYYTEPDDDVSEPAVLGMLALGLIALGFSRKRKKA